MPVAVVTGANRGIGLEFCRKLKDRGYEVIGLCRKASDELSALGIRVIDGLDVCDPQALSGLKNRLEVSKFDLLINNAGILESEGWPDLNFEAIKKQFEVNSMGPLMVTQALSSALEQGSNIIMVTSRMGSIEDNTSGGFYGYRMSKAALNAASKSLSIDLKPKGIGVFIFHPGFVQTRMTGNQGEITADQAAEGILKKYDSLSLEQTGQFWHSNGESLPW